MVSSICIDDLRRVAGSRLMKVAENDVNLETSSVALERFRLIMMTYLGACLVSLTSKGE